MSLEGPHLKYNNLYIKWIKYISGVENHNYDPREFVKAARLQLKVSCDQPEKCARKDPLPPAIIRLFHPEDDGEGAPTCAPGEVLSPGSVLDASIFI